MVDTKKLKKKMERDVLLSKGMPGMSPYERETSAGANLGPLDKREKDIQDARADRAARLSGGMKKARKR